jgi:hypothetical protein
MALLKAFTPPEGLWVSTRLGEDEPALEADQRGSRKRVNINIGSQLPRKLSLTAKVTSHNLKVVAHNHETGEHNGGTTDEQPAKPY